MMRKTLFLLMFAMFGMVTSNAQTPKTLFQKQQQLQMTIEKIQKYFVVKEEDKDLFEEQVQRLNELSKAIESGKLNASKIEKDFSEIEAKISSVQKVPAQLPLVESEGVIRPYFPFYFNTEFGELVTSYTGFSEEYNCGPICVWGRVYTASPIQVKTVLYIPKAEFLDTSNKRRTLQGFNECPKNETDLSNFHKIKEFGPHDTHLASDGNYYMTGAMSYNWDGMTDPQFTGEVSKAVFDCVHVSFENAETGEKLGGFVQDGKFISDGIVRYSLDISESIKFTASDNSVRADVWFATGGLPITNVTTFLTGYSCTIANIKWEDFDGSYRDKNEDYIGNPITPADKALTNGERAVTHAGWGEDLKAYKSFSVPGDGITLEDAAVGLYHITWEIMKPDGQPYDSGSDENQHILGIIIEGVGPAVNLTNKDGNISTGEYMSVPRPLNATGTGIKDIKQNDKIKISGFRNGILILTDESASGICKVYTVTGEEVLQQSLSPSATTIGPLRTGVYVVEVQAGAEKKTQKVYVSCNCGAN